MKGCDSNKPLDCNAFSNEEYIFQLCGVESWTELWERAPEIEFMQALMAEGLVSATAIRDRMLVEQVRISGNKTVRMRELSADHGLSPAYIRNLVYSSPIG